MAQPFRTDALRPSSLPSANLGRRHHPSSSSSAIQADPTAGPGGIGTGAGAGLSLTSEERTKLALDKEYERWNERIDRDVKAVAGGLGEIVALADIGPSPSSLTASTLPLHLPLRTSSLIRSALNIRDLAHELKLLLVLGDEQNLIRGRDEEVRAVRKEVERERREVVRLVRGLGGEQGKSHGEGEEGAEQSEKKKEEQPGLGEESALTSGRVRDQMEVEVEAEAEAVEHADGVEQTSSSPEEEANAQIPNDPSATRATLSSSSSSSDPDHVPQIGQPDTASASAGVAREEAVVELEPPVSDSDPAHGIKGDGDTTMDVDRDHDLSTKTETEEDVVPPPVVEEGVSESAPIAMAMASDEEDEEDDFEEVA